MPSSENTGYLVQLKSPEGENVYPIISAEMIKDKNGETYDLSSMKESVDGMGSTYATKIELSSVSSTVSELSSDVQECFQSVSEGKSAIAAAVTDKGVETAADATFQQIATNVGNISTINENVETVIDALSLSTDASVPGGGIAWSAALSTPVTVKKTSNNASTTMAYVRRSPSYWFSITRYDQDGTEHFSVSFSPKITWEYPLIPKVKSISFSVPSVQYMYGFSYDWGSVSISATGIDEEYIYMNMTCTPKSGYTVNDSSSAITVPLHIPNDISANVWFTSSDDRCPIPVKSAAF